jgi:hypothetical protein
MKIRHDLRLLLASAALLHSGVSLAANSIVVGDVQIDPATICCLGFSIPVTTGDDDYDATATIEYRPNSAGNWISGLTLLRVRPELTSGETPPSQYGLPFPAEQFAGSIFGLESGTDYEVRLSVTDPDGGDRVQVVNVSTRPVPRSDPAVPNIVSVSNTAALLNAINIAQPGDVIELAAGTYAGPITISNSGTVTNPIVLRGESVATVTIDATGTSYGVTIWGSFVHFEQVTVTGSTWGARSYDAEGVVIRNSRFTGVNRGIYAQSGTNRNFYICDNVLEGIHVWPNTSSATWNDEGIVISGQGHTVCHNTLSGFGDALGLAHESDIPNISIDFNGNDVRWTGDDGMELDFAHRNVRAFENRITNAAMGASLQPVWGGPVYIFRNLFLNLAASAYKLNNDPSGFFIFHNTSARTLGTGNWGAYAWTSLGYTQSDGDPAYAGNFQFKNNILVGLTNPARVTTDLILADIDYNGWSPDGSFRFVDLWVNFADLQSNSPYEANGRVLDDQTFETTLVLPADYTTLWSDPDMSLGQNSLAIDAGLPLANINSGHSGTAPDLGAIELGAAAVQYGVRQAPDTIAPSPPTNVAVQ